MTDDLMKRARAVFLELETLDGAGVIGELERLVPDDAELRAAVLGLLSDRERANDMGVMNSPTATLGSSPITESAGARVGPYKLLQRIGEGGFGSVFLAEQGEPVRRRVALKIIKLGMDTKQVIARFEAERQALALMDHPHIASVFDAGATDTGRPYFVMEYVVGDAITTFADAFKLDVRARLSLFTQVCTAVQHAHTKGVIHRDLKPANVLVSMVDGVPFAKVIDFGIAKATANPLTEKTLFTEHGQLVGTPEYMSPEQAGGSPDIDTRTDVYALGVLLYELLTGTTPFDAARLRSAAWMEMQRIIREEEPPVPSVRLSRDVERLAETAAMRQVEGARLSASIKGELDWIVMKALDKDRGRRYGSPAQFAEDVGNHLAGEAVLAAPVSAGYRVRKFVRRNKGAVVAGGAVAAALALGLGGTTVGLTEARSANAELVHQADELEWSAYVANLALAQNAMDIDDWPAARRHIANCPERKRGWEWEFLSRRAENTRAIFRSSMSAPIRGRVPVLSSNGRTAVGVRQSENGVRIVVYAIDANGDAHLVADFADEIAQQIACVSADGRYFATTPPPRIVRHDTRSFLKVWEITGDVVRLVGVADVPREACTVTSFTTDGLYLVTAARTWHGDDGISLFSWKLSDLSTVYAQSQPVDLGVATLKISPDGTCALTTSSAGSELWSLDAPEQIQRLTRHPDSNYGTFSLDGSFLALSRVDGIELWKIESPDSIALHRTLRSLGTADIRPSTHTAFHPSGDSVFAAHATGALVWDLTSNSPTPSRRIDGLSGFSAIAHDEFSNQVFLFGEGDVFALDDTTLAPRANWRFAAPSGWQDHTRMTASARQVLSFEASNFMTGNPSLWLGHLPGLSIIDFLPTALDQLWMEVLLRDTPGAWMTETKTPDGSRRIVAGPGSVVRFIDHPSGQEVVRLPMADTVTGLRMSKDGAHLAISLGDGTSRLLDLRDAKARQAGLSVLDNEQEAANAYVRDLLASAIPTDRLETTVLEDTALPPARRYLAAQLVMAHHRSVLADADSAREELNRGGYTTTTSLIAAINKTDLSPRVQTLLLEWAEDWEPEPPIPTMTWETYTRQIALTQRAIEGGEWAEARELLAECPEERRGWTWRLLNNMAQSVIREFRADRSTVSPDGEYLLTTSEAGPTLVHRVGSDEPPTRVHDLPVPDHVSQAIETARLEANGNHHLISRRYYSPSFDRLLDVHGHRHNHSHVAEPSVSLTALSATLYTTNGRVLGTVPNPELVGAGSLFWNNVAFHPDGNRIVMMRGSDVVIWTPTTNHILEVSLTEAQYLDPWITDDGRHIVVRYSNAVDAEPSTGVTIVSLDNRDAPIVVPYDRHVEELSRYRDLREQNDATDGPWFLTFATNGTATKRGMDGQPIGNPLRRAADGWSFVDTVTGEVVAAPMPHQPTGTTFRSSYFAITAYQDDRPVGRTCFPYRGDQNTVLHGLTHSAAGILATYAHVDSGERGRLLMARNGPSSQYFAAPYTDELWRHGPLGMEADAPTAESTATIEAAWEANPNASLITALADGSRAFVATNATIAVWDPVERDDVTTFDMPFTVHILKMSSGVLVAEGWIDDISAAMFFDARPVEIQRAETVRFGVELDAAKSLVDELLAGPIASDELEEAVEGDASISPVRKLAAKHFLRKRLEQVRSEAWNLLDEIAEGETDKGVVIGRADATAAVRRVKAELIELAEAWEYAPEHSPDDELEAERRQRRLTEASLALSEILRSQTPPVHLDVESIAAVIDTRVELLGERHTQTAQARWLYGTLLSYQGHPNALGIRQRALDDMAADPTTEGRLLVGATYNLIQAELAYGTLAAAETRLTELIRYLEVQLELGSDEAIDFRSRSLGTPFHVGYGHERILWTPLPDNSNFRPEDQRERTVDWVARARALGLRGLLAKDGPQYLTIDVGTEDEPYPFVVPSNEAHHLIRLIPEEPEIQLVYALALLRKGEYEAAASKAAAFEERGRALGNLVLALPLAIRGVAAARMGDIDTATSLYEQIAAIRDIPREERHRRNAPVWNAVGFLENSNEDIEVYMRELADTMRGRPPR